MHLFTCTEFTGELGYCSEGDLYFVEKSKLRDLPMWEGDFIFLGLLDTRKDFFSLKLEYKGVDFVFIGIFVILLGCLICLTVLPYKFTSFGIIYDIIFFKI